MIFDLHSHSSCSDGELNRRELIRQAVENGVDVLAITDHDTVDAFRDTGPETDSIKLVPGVEFSTQWENTGIHVLGLNIDPGSDAIEAGVGFQSNARLDRAERIGANLEKQGIPDAFEGALALSAGGYVGRPHFARHLVNTGKVKSLEAAFKKYLGDGKVGDVRQHWAELPQILQWIRDANGIAVLAHPLKYKLTRSKLKRLLDDFIRSGGRGMEVVSGQQTVQQTSDLARLCEQKGLLASCGSDFHGPGKAWSALGQFSPLPGYLTPVWDQF